MDNNKFAHLHVHSDYSPLDGLGTLDEYISRTVEMGFESLAITDHGDVTCAIEFQKKGKAAGINTIIGTELYVTDNMLVKTPNSKHGHMTVWVENQSGWEALCRMMTKANIDGFYRKPRVDYETILNEDISGLIFGTACAGSFLWLDGSDEFFHNLINKRGKDGVFIELMPHDLDKQHQLHELYKTLYSDVYKIVTNDAHYVRKRDHELHEVLLAISSKRKWSDPKRWKIGLKTLYLCSANEMMRWFKEQGQFNRKDILDAMENTLIIADRCKDFKIEPQGLTLPDIPYDLKGLTEDEELEKLCRKGMDRFGLTGNKIYEDRLTEELTLIKKKGFSRYFLIVIDFLEWCRSENIGLGPGRGSVGGALIAHLTGITEGLDPIKYELLFSRFLNPDRIDWPDIDMDVEQRHRQKAVKYLYETYGEKFVCGIATDGTMKAKAAVRDVGRILELPYDHYDGMSKAIFDRPGQDGDPIDNAIKKSRDAKFFAKQYPRQLGFIRRLIGKKRQGGRHAAGIIVAGEDLTTGKRCVLIRRSGHIIANWSMSDVEYNGLMKLDVLGLATVSVMKYCEQLIQERYDKGFRLENIQPGEDVPELYEMINNGDTSGIFQVSARPMTELCVRMKLSNFDDLVASLALVRPGPMDAGLTDKYIDRKHGEEWEPIHPIYEKITEKTYGVTCYQEQVARVFIEIAGMKPGEADKLRKIITKKRDASEFEPYKIKFMEGCANMDTFTQEQAEDFWNGLLEFAKYCFNLSHSVAYALIAYRTAWLKVKYPIEFYAATLTYGSYNEKHYDESKHRQHVIDEIEKLGIKIMPPKIGISKATEWGIHNDILFAPFSEIKGVGEVDAQKYIDWKPRPKAKNRGFFGYISKDAENNKKTKMDLIIEEIDATNPDSITSGALNKLEFHISKDSKPAVGIRERLAKTRSVKQPQIDEEQENRRARNIRVAQKTAGVVDNPLKEDDSEKYIVVYTDGTITKNPGGIGGAGIYMKYKGKENRISMNIGDGCTNNISELSAIKIALENIKAKGVPVRVFTDSMYCKGVLTMGWKINSNEELVRATQDEISKFKDLKIIHIRGHQNIYGNEEADKLAKGAVGVKYVPPKKQYRRG